ncbi:non-ribosomal peptide synthetase [Streptomyces ficellus]|uniref:Non-ribosomal peptide synthetase n=1 Tax=Streptomyces ficellus TaxID=1977088 RepID=A0A6I6FW83_9ACTN|nr:non-ribosomal peptide synthetase [Streptomyces ficellus]QGV82298.1 non-ribosomal peptide synthetase [Streptomyces ficellus]
MLSITTQYLARYHALDSGAGAPAVLPVTGAQRRFVLVRSLDPAGRPDLVPMFFAFPRGTVDLERLAAAATRLAALHPVLRARPAVVRGTPVLRVEEPDVPVVRVPRAPGEDAATALRRALGTWDREGPPLRLFLSDEETAPDHEATTDAGREVLAIVLDHTACDGRSLARIVTDLGAAYADGPYAEAPGPADVAAELAAYREAVLLQLDAEERAASPEALAHWGDRLRAVRDQSPAPRPGAPTAGGLPSGSASLVLPATAGGVPFPELLDACRPAARALYGPGHVVPLGYPWGGRPPGAERVLGCFLNTVVFPAATGAAPTCPEVTADAWWDDLDRADVPFDAVVHAARAAGSGWSGRLDGLLTVDDATQRPPLRLAGVEGREVHIDGRPVRGPFAVSVTQGRALHLRMAWDRAVIADDAAREAFDAMADALTGAAATAARTAPPSD